MCHNIFVVGGNNKLVCSQFSEPTYANSEIHFYFRRECSQHLSRGHINGCDGHLDAFFCEDVWIDAHFNALRNDFDSSNALHIDNLHDGIANIFNSQWRGC